METTPRQIEAASISVELLTDGTARVQETYQIMSSKGFRHLTFFLQKPLHGELADVSISLAHLEDVDASPPYNLVTKYEQKSGLGRAPFSYELTETATGSRYFLTGRFEAPAWSVRLEYTVKDAVLATGTDAVLRLRILGTESVYPVSYLSGSIKLPSVPSSDSKLDFVPVSEIDVQTSFNNEREYRFMADTLDREDKIALFLRMPANLFSALLLSNDARTADEQVEGAKATSKRSVDRRSAKEAVHILIPILTLAGCLLWGIYFLYFEREGKKQKVADNFAVWPSSMPSNMVGLLLGRRRLSSMVLATLLRLASFRELTLDDYVFTWKNPDRSDFRRFSPFEVLLLHWLFEDLEMEDHALSVFQIEAYARSPLTKATFKKSCNTLAKMASERFNRLKLDDKRKSWFALFFGLLFGFAFGVTAILLTIIGRTPFGLALLVPGLLFFFTGQQIRHLNARGLKRRGECRAFEASLNNPEKLFASNKDVFTPIESAIIALPHAAALGRLDNFFEGLYKLPDRRYIECGYALLRVYNNQEIPAHIANIKESREHVRKELERVKTILQTSQATLDRIISDIVY
jgi:hypothetical protein